MTSELADLPLFTVRREATRRKSNRDRLRAVLSDGQPHTNVELTQVAGFRYGARVEDLRKGKGRNPPLVIHRYSLGDGLWSFRADESGAFDSRCDSCPRCRRGA